MAEMAALLRPHVRGHVVLIDDARLFDGTGRLSKSRGFHYLGRAGAARYDGRSRRRHHSLPVRHRVKRIFQGRSDMPDRGTATRLVTGRCCKLPVACRRNS